MRTNHEWEKNKKTWKILQRYAVVDPQVRAIATGKYNIHIPKLGEDVAESRVKRKGQPVGNDESFLSITIEMIDHLTTYGRMPYLPIQSIGHHQHQLPCLLYSATGYTTSILQMMILRNLRSTARPSNLASVRTLSMLLYRKQRVVLLYAYRHYTRLIDADI